MNLHRFRSMRKFRNRYINNRCLELPHNRTSRWLCETRRTENKRQSQRKPAVTNIWGIPNIFTTAKLCRNDQDTLKQFLGAKEDPFCLSQRADHEKDRSRRFFAILSVSEPLPMESLLGAAENFFCPAGKTDPEEGRSRRTLAIVIVYGPLTMEHLPWAQRMIDFAVSTRLIRRKASPANLWL